MEDKNYKAFQLRKLDLRSYEINSPLRVYELCFDLPGEKVNTFGKVVMEDFQTLLPDLKKHENEIDLLFFTSGKKDQFVAGADIKLIQSATNAKDAKELSALFQNAINEFEDLKFAKVSCVHGNALGGGCEFSLACDAIVMSTHKSSKLGLPEIQLGLLPGGGGCVRMPSRVGLAKSLELILSGSALDSKRALKAGLIDAALPHQNYFSSCVRWGIANYDSLKNKKRVSKKPPLGGVGGWIGSFLESSMLGRQFIFHQAKSGVIKKTKGHYPAAFEVILTLQRIHRTWGDRISKETRKKYMDIESSAFGKCYETEACKNLIQLFFMLEEIKKNSGSSSIQKEELSLDVVAGVLGAGTMGGGIAQLFSSKDMAVVMKDLKHEALELGLQSASKVYSSALKRKRISFRDMMKKMFLITPTLENERFREAKFVVEAVVENMDIKKKVLAELEAFTPQDAILTTNTSSLSVNEMQKVLKRPENFLGMHFFNPVHKMPLIEVIRAEKTSEKAVATVFEMSKKLGKFPIVVKDSPGFLVNRLLGIYLNEAGYLYKNKVSIEKIDRAMLDFGMPMGPFELLDEVGLDVAEKVGKILFDGFGDRFTPSLVQKGLIDQGHLGKKSKKGFYHYDAQGKKMNVEPSLAHSSETAVSNQEIVDRCVLSMVNEASRCLQEGIVTKPSEVDMGMIMGTGFPPFRGGLLHYADDRGLIEIAKRLEFLESHLHSRFQPHSSLLERAKTGGNFYE